VAEGLGDVALADARLADEQHVVLPLHEGARAELEHLRLRHRPVELEVEVLERPRVLEACPPKTLVELLGVAALDLVRDQPVEELGVREIVVDRLARPKVEALEDPGEPQLLQQRDDLVNEAHRSPPPAPSA
jgi:hypothetical protein